jgi:hypothetical protein
MRLIVCGSAPRRTGAPGWTDRALLYRVLDEIAPAVVVEGGAAGADRLAREWAQERAVPVETFPADWKRYGRAAGPRRNREMVEAGADLVVGFSVAEPPTSGTAGMLRLATDAGLRVRLVLPE